MGKHNQSAYKNKLQMHMKKKVHLHMNNTFTCRRSKNTNGKENKQSLYTTQQVYLHTKKKHAYTKKNHPHTKKKRTNMKKN